MLFSQWLRQKSTKIWLTLVLIIFGHLTIFYAVLSLLIGYLVKCMMNLFTASGSLITQQIGFGAVAYFDPSTAQRVGPFEKLFNGQWSLLLLALVLFFRCLKESLIHFLAFMLMT